MDFTFAAVTFRISVLKSSPSEYREAAKLIAFLYWVEVGTYVSFPFASAV